MNILTGDQFDPEFLKISPNNKMPAMVDHDGPDGKPYAVFESGAMLLYLAEKTGQFMPAGMAERYTVIQWLMFQMGGIGPMLGQAHHFRLYAPEKIEYAFNRYTNEATRLYRVVDTRLAEVEYLAGDYSIADMATYPWLRYHENQGQKLEDYPYLKRWYDALSARAGSPTRARRARRREPFPPADGPAGQESAVRCRSVRETLGPVGL